METAKQQIVIVGAGYAGMLAALRLAKRTRRQPVAITLINAQDRFVERIRLHQLATNQPLADYPISRMLHGTGVTFTIGFVTAVDPVQKQITVQERGTARQIAYDKLVYALGSQTDVSRTPGVAEHAFTLDYASAAILRQRLPEVAKRGGRVLVVGTGLTGIETTAEIAETYPSLQVTLVTRGTLGSDLSSMGQAYLRKVYQTLGVSIREKTTVSRLEAGQAVTADGTVLPFDLCVWTGGFGVSPLARQSGLAVNAKGQILIDAMLRSISHPDIYAVGDATAFGPDAGLSLRMACATAMPMAAHAADNLTDYLRGAAEQPFRFGFGGRCISLGRRKGLVQLVEADDTPLPHIITGSAGAFIKELICRYTTFSLSAQGRWATFYQWPRTRSAKATRTMKALTARG